MLKVYEAVFKNSDTQGMYALSLVENPAMEDQWILLSEHPKEIKFEAVDEVKNLLLGAVLIPNKKILRNVDGHKFFVTFTAETIEKIGHDFIRKGNQTKSKLEHQTELKDVSVVESWTVQDSLKDKSSLYGKNYEVGTLVQMMKVDDETYKLAKEDKIKGFSIDALLGLEELKLNKDMNTNKSTDEMPNWFKAIFSKTDEALTKEVEDLKAELTTQKESIESDHKVKLETVTGEKETLEATNVALTQEIKDLKVELSKQETDKDKEIADLKVELDKKPEVEPIVGKPNLGESTTNTAPSIKERVFENLQNILE